MLRVSFPHVPRSNALERSLYTYPEDSMARMSTRRCLTLTLLGLILAITVPAYAQNFTVLHAFTGTPDGAEPYQSDLLDVNGTLFGTTGGGGTYGYGTIFKLNSKGQEKVLYSFTGGTDGFDPSSGLVRDGSGNLYGTTFFGGDISCSIFGSVGCGVVYKLSATGTFSVLYSFTAGADGAWPQGVVLDSVGNLYGPAFYGGLSPQCCGVIFKLDTGGNETPLYTFNDGADGGVPNGFLTIDSAGNLYGAATLGGDLSACSGAGCGVLFKVDSAGHETVRYTFTGGADGAGPNGALLLDARGNLFGTAFLGGDLNCVISQGSPGCGVVFEVTPTGVEKVLHTFTGADGAGPSYGLLRDAAGNFFDTTIYGGTANVGTVFEVNSKGEKVLYSFHGTTDGAYPQSGLVRDAKGNLFSNTVFGGDQSCTVATTPGCGTVFKLVAPPQIIGFSPTSGPVGTAVTISGVSLSQTTKVRFNGVAASFTVNSDTRLTATVPTGATTGKIGVSSPGGTTASATSFTVTP